MKKFAVSFLSLIILTLCVVSAILIYIAKDTIKHSFIAYQAIDYLNYQIPNNLAFEKIIMEIINKTSKNEKISETNQLDIRRKLCNYKIEYGIDIIQISDAYICLAKLDESSGNTLYALKNISYSIDLLADTNNTAYLENIIIGNQQEEALSILEKNHLNLHNWVGKDMDIEVKTLEALAQAQNNHLSTRANYRLSLIYTFGRVNSDSNKNIDIKKAFDYQKRAINQMGDTPPKNTNVAFVFDEKYAQYAATTITSMILNSDLDNNYTFYVVMDSKNPITEETQKKIASISSVRDFNIKFIEFPESLIEENKELLNSLQENKRYPRLVYFRILLGKLLPDLEKLLITDVDILVYRDLYDLSNIELDQYLVAAVVDPYNFRNGRLVRRSKCEAFPPEFFNVGIMVQNLKLMTKEDVYTQFQKTGKKFICDNLFPEQDNLNITTNRRALFLSSRWNMIPIKDDYEGIYPNGFMPFIVHHANVKPYSKFFLDKIKNGQKIPEHISTYYIYNDFAKKFLADR